MLLSTMGDIKDTGDDYLLLLDYGHDGIVVHSQHVDVQAAMQARDEYKYGQPMAIVKVCRSAEPVEILG